MEFLNILPYILIFILVIAIIILFRKVIKSGFKILSLETRSLSLSRSLSECRSNLLSYQGSYSKFNKDKGVGCLGIDPYESQHPRTPEQSYKKNPFKNSKKIELHDTVSGGIITYKSIREASRITKISRHRIIKSCDEGGSITHGTSFFKYAKNNIKSGVVRSVEPLEKSTLVGSMKKEAYLSAMPWVGSSHTQNK